MSFMDELGKAAQSLGNADPQQTAAAASDTVNQADPDDLADHMTQSVGNLDGGSLSKLGGELLQAFNKSGDSAPDADGAAQAAGVSQDAVAGGEPGAVDALLQYAKAHPDVLKSAAGAFLQKNPGAVGSLAPGLLQGIMGRLGGGTSS
ncbi:MAG: hypothetical protein GIX01_11800 [Candidatus Eremiobacteraeota bacterium]|nr:hypothetical protein [Candidatus Eremiobacteraeota bacterium]